MTAPFRFSLWFLTPLLVLLVGCAEEPGPDESHRHYVQALVEGRLADAFDLLSARSRADLAAQEPPEERDPARPGFAAYKRHLARAGEAGLPVLPADAAEGVQEAHYDSPRRARVPVSTPEGLRHALWVRESGGWRLQLAPPGRSDK